MNIKWKVIKLSDAILYVIGGDWGKDPDTINSTDFVEVFCIRGAELRGWEKNKGKTASLRKIKTLSAEKRKLVKGDIIIEISGGGPDQPVGRTAYIDEDVLINFSERQAVCTNFFRLMRLSNEIDKKYVDYYLKYFYKTGKVVDYQGGSNNLRNLRFNDFISIDIPLPPLNEQKRMVQKLDNISGRIESIKERMDTIPRQLNQFRQSVLNAAVTGKLTEEWRKKIKLDANQDLLKVKKIKNKLIKDGKLKNNKLESIKNEDSWKEVLPDSWTLAILNDIFSFIDYRGKTPKKANKGKRLITAKNIKMGVLSNDPIEYMSDKDYGNWMTRGYPKINDIFFVTEGHTLGNVALNNRIDEFALAQRTITLQPISNVCSKFFFYAFMTTTFQNLVEKNATGTAAKGIKAAKFKNLPILFPSIDEQNEICSIVENLFTKAQLIEQHYNNLKAQLDLLPKAMLAKTFRGELVPQDPDDEPVEILIDRIIEEKSKLKKKTKKSLL